MKNNEFQNKMTEMQKKIGNDASNLILDDIGLLLTDNQNMNDELSKRDKEIQSLKQTNEMLQRVNGNLLQQVAMGDDDEPKSKEPEKKEPFDFRSVFDENGNFKK
jgi:hypothetical protein